MIHINKIISFRHGWDLMNSQYSNELEDLKRALNEAIPSFLSRLSPSRNNKFEVINEVWRKALSARGWYIDDGTLYESPISISVHNLGPIKNSVSAYLSVSAISFLNTWVFQRSSIAIKHGEVKVPVLLIPIKAYGRTMSVSAYNRLSFENCLEQLNLLVPLGHAYPFLIIGYSDESSDLEVFELQTADFLNNKKVVVDRCLEFPPEYHQAGLNILSYFGTYISEQYPNENAKVKIEQDGKLVRLIIESDNGKQEVIEKALNEYELFVTGKRAPEEITDNQLLVLEMRNELRMAKFRVESQQDIIRIQNRTIDTLNDQMQNFMNLVGEGLRSRPSISIDFKPTFNVSSSTSTQVNFRDILSQVGELKQMIPNKGNDHIRLSDLEGSLGAIEKETNSEVIKSSPALAKLKQLLDEIADEKTTLHKVVKATESGWATFKNLAGKYNSVAEWCGLPQVPKIFTKQ
jgi:hypothetical protein